MWAKEQLGTGCRSSPCPLAADQSCKSPRVKGQKPAGNIWESLSGRSTEGSWRGQEKEATTCNHRNQSEVSGETGRHRGEPGRHRGEPGSRTQTGQSRWWHAPSCKDQSQQRSHRAFEEDVVSLTEMKGKWEGQRDRDRQVTTYYAGLLMKEKQTEKSAPEAGGWLHGYGACYASKRA